jgi:PAS domain S-box-containing protein
VLLSLTSSFFVSALLSIVAVGGLNYFYALPIFNRRVGYPLDVILVAAFLLTSLIVTGLVGRVRRQTEAALHAQARAEQAESEMRLAIDTIPALAWRTEPDGFCDFLNQPWRDYTGLSSDQALGWGWTSAIHPDDVAGLLNDWRAIRESGARGEAEARLRRFDGEFRSFLFCAQPLRREADRIVKWYGTTIDIEERKRVEVAEEALRASQAELAHVTRVTMLGQLSASIAHEVNQPLAAIVTNAQACLRWLGRETPDLDEARGSVERIGKEGARAAEVIRRVRALSHKTEIEKVPLDINSVVNDVAALLQRELFRHRVPLRMELSPSLPMVLADRVQLQQVLINLVMNGIEAMHLVADRPRELVIGSHEDDAHHVRVTVKDCGVGITDENENRLFTAFFTTKPSGLGMGLPICRSIMEAHGGRLWASRNVGPGATFQFTLPPHGNP